jgi:hypothetical protein
MRTLTATRRSSRVDICHVSLTTEMMSTYIWPHWREGNPVAGEVYYRMEPMESAQLKDVMATRKILHSYIDYAMGERLKFIKATLPPFWQDRPVRQARRRQSQSSTTASNFAVRYAHDASSSSRGGENAFQTKKSKRVQTDGMYQCSCVHLFWN